MKAYQICHSGLLGEVIEVECTAPAGYTFTAPDETAPGHIWTGGGWTPLYDTARITELECADTEYMLEQTKALRLVELSSVFDRYVQHAHMLSSLGYEIDADDTANRNVSGLVKLLSSEGAPETIEFCDYYNELHPITLKDAVVLEREIIQNGSLLYAKKYAYRKAIQEAEDRDTVYGIVFTF